MADPAPEPILSRFVPRLGDVLGTPGSCHLYPTRSERGAWTGLPAAARSAVVTAGEAHTGFDWPAVQARHYLIYRRHGRQADLLDVRAARRVALGALVLSECVEAEGRFVDDIANGIWAICEESYWGNPGPLYMQQAGRGFPDPAERIVELGTGETAALLAWTQTLLGESLDEVSPIAAPSHRARATYAGPGRLSGARRLLVDGILVPALVIFALLQDHITRGITQGAVKG
jgi:hypothetical protein